MHTPNKITRTVYVVTLLLVTIPFAFQKATYAILLLEQVGRNPNILNPVIAIIYLLVAMIIFAIVFHRVYEIVMGRLTLSFVSESKFTSGTRNAGLLFMYFGLVIIIIGILYSLVIGIGPVSLIVSYFRPLIPIGLILFEFSRLKGHELALKENGI